MKYPSGPPRKLNDRQIREVLAWYQRAENFRRCHGTVRDLAALLGVSSHAVRGVVEHSGRIRDIAYRLPENRRGRPRHLNPSQVKFVIAWREAGRRFLARQRSVADLAHKMNVSASTIHDCIRRKGRYSARAPPTSAAASEPAIRRAVFAMEFRCSERLRTRG